jgi:hypothetical protein
VTLSTTTVSTKLAQIADGQQRVMRLSGAPLWSPVETRVLTNRMREIFTYGSVGGAEGNLGSYPAVNPAFASLLHTQHHWRGVPDPARWARSHAF